jgi:hypothetical protein
MQSQEMGHTGSFSHQDSRMYMLAHTRTRYPVTARVNSEAHRSLRNGRRQILEIG